jgi:hypothetical protein
VLLDTGFQKGKYRTAQKKENSKFRVFQSWTVLTGGQKAFPKAWKSLIETSVADPGSGAFLTPGLGIRDG